MSELEQFVIGYLQEAGGIVEPPAYGVYEALLPEAVAEKWRVPAYLQLAFSETPLEEATRLGYNHPLVEQMVQEAHGRYASTCLYVNNLRLDKSGVDETAIKSWVILNARAQPAQRSTPSRVRSSYVRFNFKAAILSDEKQERLVSVLMDAHTGTRVAGAEAVETAATAVSADTILASLPDAPVRWRPKDGPPFQGPLAERTLAALLERAKTAVLQEMQEDMNALQKRVARFRRLDEARLTDYYDTLEQDLRGRLQTASAERRAGLQDKLTAVQTERRHKLADLAERYQVRVNLTLLNVLVIQQPKLVQTVQISNRSTRIGAYAVWDPLLRRPEPLHCQVCGQVAHRLYLCHNGHLAHEDCLAPACIDCKRVFCADCAQEVGACDVCGEPLCVHSQITCPECGRHTCQEHRELCHAENGRPVDLSKSAPADAPPKEQKPAKPETPTTPARQSRRKTPPRTATPKPKPKPARAKVSGPKALRIEVVLYVNGVTAFALGKRDREIAVRTWEFSPPDGGILCRCQCEKGDECQEDRMVTRPSEAQFIEKHMRDELAKFAAEYGFSPQKIRYNRVSTLSSEPYPVPRFELLGHWKDEAALQEARETFARLYWK